MRQIYKPSLLIAGIVLTIFWVVLAGKIYSHLYFGQGDVDGNLEYFRADLLQYDWTIFMALITAAVPWAIAVLFYYIIDSVHFDRWWHWLIVLGIAMLLTAGLDSQYITPRMVGGDMMRQSYYSPYLLSLAGWNAMIGGVCFIIASFAIRWWSGNCRHTPLPQ